MADDLESLFDKVIQNALDADAALSAVVTGIHAGVAPQANDSGDGSAFPYVVIDAVDFGEYSDGSHTGHEVLMTIFTFSRSPGRKECKEIQSMIKNVLHRKNSALSITGYSFILIDRDGSTVEDPVDNDGSFRGVCEYRALVTKNAAD